jgi:hypothetical protein
MIRPLNMPAISAREDVTATTAPRQPTAEEKAKGAVAARLSALPKKTVTVAFRIPRSEKERLEKLFTESGLSLAQAAKMAVYRFAKELSQP